MTFNFSWLCDLLEDLARNRHLHSTTAARAQNPEQRIIISWFNRHDGQISRTGPSAVALLSALLPERRVDRVYNLRETRLSAIFGRALGLGHRRAQELNQWYQQDRLDFSTCIERVMAQCEFEKPPPEHEVTLEEVDSMLHQLAANSPFSSPQIRADRNYKSADEILTPVLRRLQSRDAKWLIRMLLKSFIDVRLPERVILSSIHFLLPYLLALQNSFDAAVEILSKASIRTLPARPGKDYEKALLQLTARDVVPKTGVMIQRQPYYKARSIKHCCGMAEEKRMSVERKYDGEYCQIHVDLSKGHNCIQIFSKSGKDSTQDRIGLHGIIKDCLRIGQKDCQFQRQCIIEGELLVWSSYRKCILPFHKIRKYVRHGGRRLGAAADSPVRSNEHLMVALYDILLLDDEILLNKPLTVRRRCLKSAARVIEGRSILGERTLIDFASRNASTQLRQVFAKAITDRWEGFVLKFCDEAYFSWQSTNHGIKLKKDYITGLGDSVDVCLIGGRHDARVELELGFGPLKWTSFHVGCLVNKDDVRRFNTTPKFKVIDELTHHSMSRNELLDFNKLGQYVEVEYISSASPFELDFVRSDLGEPSEVFKEPFIIEISGAGFEKPSDCDFYTLRFPRRSDGKAKLHIDRSITDTITFDELQATALESLEPSPDQDMREEELWLQRLLQADGKSRSPSTTFELSSHCKSPKAMRQVRPASMDFENRPTFIRADTVELFEDEGDENSPQKQNYVSIGSLKSSHGLEATISSCHTSLKRTNEVLGELRQPRASKKALTASVGTVDGSRRGAYARSSDSPALDFVPRNGEFSKDPSFKSLTSFVKESVGGGENDNPTNQQAISFMPSSNSTTTSYWLPSEKSVLSHSTQRVRTQANTANMQNAIVPKSTSVMSQQVLPTPPSSGSCKSISTSKEQTERQSPPISSDCASTKIIGNIWRPEEHLCRPSPASIIPKLAKLIYIPSSVSYTSDVKCKRQLYKALGSIDISYTHVLEILLNAVNEGQPTDTASNSADAHVPTFHIMLLDFNDPVACKADLDALFNAIVVRASGTGNMQISAENSESPSGIDPCTWFKDSIMFWDYSIIHHWTQKQQSRSNDIAAAGPEAPTQVISPMKSDTKPKACHPSSTGLPLQLDLSSIALMQHDHIGADLFAGFMHLHRQTWLERRVKRYFLVKHWKWADP